MRTLCVSFDGLSSTQKHKLNDCLFIGQSLDDDICISDPLPDHKKQSLPVLGESDLSCDLSRFDEQIFFHSYLRRFRNVGYIPYDLAWRDTALYIYSVVYTFFENREITKVIFSNIPHQFYDQIIEYEAHRREIPCYFLYQEIDGKTSEIFQLPTNQDETPFSRPKLVYGSMHGSTEFDPKNLYYMKMFESTSLMTKLKKQVIDFRKRVSNFSMAMDNPKGYLKKAKYINREKRKIAVFYLHMQPEQTTNRLARFWESPLKVLLDLKFILPDDWVIYVREHPNQITGYGRSFIMQEFIQRDSRIYWQDKDQRSDETLMISDLIVTNTGTVVREALQAGKNCLIYGHYPGNLTNGMIVRESINTGDDVEQFFKTEKEIKLTSGLIDFEDKFTLAKPSHRERYDTQDEYDRFIVECLNLLEDQKC